MQDTPGPRGNYVWSVDVAPDGRVWIGHGQSYDDGLGIGILQHNNTFDDSSAANRGQAWRFDDRWEFLNLDNGPEATSVIITDLDVADAAMVVVATKDMRQGDGEGLRLLDSGSNSWRPLTTAATGLPSNQIAHVTWDADRDTLWVATRTRGLARFDGQAWTSWQAFQVGPQVATVTLDVGRGKSRIPVDLADQAAFEAAFDSSPRYMRLGDDPTPYRIEQYLQIGNGRYVDVVPDVPNALKKDTPVYSVERGPPSNGGGPICLSADGTVWTGGRETMWLGSACPREWGTECWLDGGLGRFDGSHWQVLDQWTKDANGKSVPDQEVQSCAVDKLGRIWVGTGDPRAAEGDGIAVLDPQSGNWTTWRKTQGVPFAGNGVSGIDVDSVTGDVWASHHASQFCEPPPFGGICTLIRVGGGVSRWNGSKWDIWQKPAAPLAAFGAQGELTSVAVDRAAGRVWAGGWDAQPKNFHWLQGTGINAALNWCPLDCTNGAWESKVWPEDGDVVALEVDDDGHLWAGTHRYGNGIIPSVSGVKLYDGSQWLTYTPENSGLASNEITALDSQTEGMWVGTRVRGISHYDSFVPPTPTPTGLVHAHAGGGDADDGAHRHGHHGADTGHCHAAAHQRRAPAAGAVPALPGAEGAVPRRLPNCDAGDYDDCGRSHGHRAGAGDSDGTAAQRHAPAHVHRTTPQRHPYRRAADRDPATAQRHTVAHGHALAHRHAHPGAGRLAPVHRPDAAQRAPQRGHRAGQRHGLHGGGAGEWLRVGWQRADPHAAEQPEEPAPESPSPARPRATWRPTKGICTTRGTAARAGGCPARAGSWTIGGRWGC